jgi:hypothetical protein
MTSLSYKRASTQALPIRNSVEYCHDGIVRIVKAGEQTSQTSVNLAIAALRQIDDLRQKQDDIYILLDMRGAIRQGHHGEEAILRADWSALAILGTSTFTRVVSNLLIKRHKPLRPVRYFSNSKKATHWLHNWRDKQ